MCWEYPVEEDTICFLEEDDLIQKNYTYTNSYDKEHILTNVFNFVFLVAESNS